MSWGDSGTPGKGYLFLIKYSHSSFIVYEKVFLLFISWQTLAYNDYLFIEKEKIQMVSESITDNLQTKHKMDEAVTIKATSDLETERVSNFLISYKNSCKKLKKNSEILFSELNQEPY